MLLTELQTRTEVHRRLQSEFAALSGQADVLHSQADDLRQELAVEEQEHGDERDAMLADNERLQETVLTLQVLRIFFLIVDYFFPPQSEYREMQADLYNIEAAHAQLEQDYVREQASHQAISAEQQWLANEHSTLASRYEAVLADKEQELTQSVKECERLKVSEEAQTSRVIELSRTVSELSQSAQSHSAAWQATFAELKERFAVEVNAAEDRIAQLEDEIALANATAQAYMSDTSLRDAALKGQAEVNEALQKQRSSLSEEVARCQATVAEQAKQIADLQAGRAEMMKVLESTRADVEVGLSGFASALDAHLLKQSEATSAALERAATRVHESAKKVHASHQQLDVQHLDREIKLQEQLRESREQCVVLEARLTAVAA
jgi:hypothetical protein